MSTDTQVGSGTETPKHEEGSEQRLTRAADAAGVQDALGGGSFTTFFTWRGNGAHTIPFHHSSSLSERTL